MFAGTGGLHAKFGSNGKDTYCGRNLCSFMTAAEFPKAADPDAGPASRAYRHGCSDRPDVGDGAARNGSSPRLA